MAMTRTWSFTRLWAMIVATWFAAVAAGLATNEGSALRMIPLALAIVPAFLAGSWAGSHREIRDWSMIRLVAMWGLCAAGFGAASDMSDSWPAAALIALPVAILSIRWLELRRELPALPSLSAQDPVRLTTPPTGSPGAPRS